MLEWRSEELTKSSLQIAMMKLDKTAIKKKNSTPWKSIPGITQIKEHLFK